MRIAIRLFIFVCFFVVFWAQSGFFSKIYSKKNKYSQSSYKDFNADAPWRVETKDTPIPFVFMIKDVFTNTLDALNTVSIYIHQPPFKNGSEKLVYLNDFGGISIKSTSKNSINGNWEWNVDTFKNPADSNKDGLPLTPKLMGFKEGEDIFFKLIIKGEDGFWTDVHVTKYLKVHVGIPLPKPDFNWYYGDTHYHTEYTDNPYEFGGTLISTKNSVLAMGLDWITTTDHASDVPDSDYWFGSWDLSDNKNNKNGSSWESLKTRANAMNDENNLPFIIGEEITCRPVANVQDDQIHLLVYNNDNYVSGKITPPLATLHARYSLKSRLDLLPKNAFAYAAHPMSNMDSIFAGRDKEDKKVPLIGVIVPWSDKNYETAINHERFSGLELWNTRATRTIKWSNRNYINPFNKDGTFGNLNQNWDKKLLAGIERWDGLLMSNISPLKKVFIEGGSDAHGDINYAEHGFLKLAILRDSALGKVRTLVYSPAGSKRNNILESLKNGNSVITDGPIAIFGVDQNDDNLLNEGDAYIGSDIFLSAGTPLNLFIEWYSTKEFGVINEIEIIRGGQDGVGPVATITPERNEMNGNIVWTQNELIEDKTYYYRIESRIKDKNGKILYRSYSNPIWVTWDSSQRLPDFL